MLFTASFYDSMRLAPDLLLVDVERFDQSPTNRGYHTLFVSLARHVSAFHVSV